MTLTYCLTSTTAHAAAWTQKKKQLQFISGLSAYRSQEYYDLYGDSKKQTPFYKAELSAYAEYGVNDWLTLGGQTSYAGVAQKTNATDYGSTTQLSDSEIFLRSRVWHDEQSVLSLQPFLILPSLDKSSSTPKVGSDHASLGLKTAYGHSFQWFDRWHYIDVSASYVQRNGLPSNQLKFDATAGLNVTSRWQVLPQLFITQNQGKIQNRIFTQSNADDYDATTLQLSAIYQYNKVTSLQFGAFGNIDGKNTGVGRGMLFNVILQLDCSTSCLVKR